MAKQSARQASPLSIEEHIDRIDARVRLALAALDNGIAEKRDSREAVLNGVAQALLDTLEDLDVLQGVRFPVSEYRGEPFEDWARQRLSAKSGAR